MAAHAAVPDLTRIAVLPMVDLGPPADASLVAGLAEELTSRLAGVRRDAVPSSTTLSAYDRRGKTLAQVVGTCASTMRSRAVCAGAARAM